MLHALYHWPHLAYILHRKEWCLPRDITLAKVIKLVCAGTPQACTCLVLEATPLAEA